MVAKNSAKGGKQEPQEIRQDSLINLISAEAETYLPDINTNLGPFVLHFAIFPYLDSYVFAPASALGQRLSVGLAFLKGSSLVYLG